MFDLGWQELFIIAVLALLVVGPKDLPKALRTVTQVVRKARGLAGDFRRSVDDVIREAELDEIKNQVKAAGQVDLNQRAESFLDPEGDLRDSLTGAPDQPSGGGLDAKTRKAVAEMNPEDDASAPVPGNAPDIKT